MADTKPSCTNPGLKAESPRYATDSLIVDIKKISDSAKHRTVKYLQLTFKYTKKLYLVKPGIDLVVSHVKVICDDAI